MKHAANKNVRRQRTAEKEDQLAILLEEGTLSISHRKMLITHLILEKEYKIPNHHRLIIILKLNLNSRLNNY